jgi:hypothetical protein
MAEADHDDTSSQCEWVSPRKYVKRIARDPAAETEAECSIFERFRCGKLPHRYRASNGELHYNDLSADFLREADIDFATATATRPARIIREPNPHLPYVRGDFKPKPQWVGNPFSRCDWDPFSRPEYIDRKLPAETITELKFLVPRAPTVEPPAKSDPLDVKDWLFDAVCRRKEAGDIPTGAGAVTLLAKQLEKQMAVDVLAGKCRTAIAWKSIRARLYELKLLRPPK